MELIWKELPGERIIYTGVSQGTVEGGIPLPEGRSAKEILSYTGEVAISSSSAREGEIAIEGVVRIDLICMDDKVFAFTSSAPFTHRIAADGVREGMRTEVQAALPGQLPPAGGDRGALRHRGAVQRGTWGAEGRISRQRRNMPGGYAVHIGAGTEPHRGDEPVKPGHTLHSDRGRGGADSHVGRGEGIRLSGAGG